MKIGNLGNRAERQTANTEATTLEMSDAVGNQSHPLIVKLRQEKVPWVTNELLQRKVSVALDELKELKVPLMMNELDQ